MTVAHVESDMRKHSRPVAELPVVVSDAVNRVSARLRGGAPGLPGGQSSPASPLLAFLRSDLLFEVGEVLNLNIDVPGGGALGARCRVEGISRGTDDESPTGMAIALVDLSPGGRATLEAALR